MSFFFGTEDVGKVSKRCYDGENKLFERKLASVVGGYLYFKLLIDNFPSP